MNRIKEQAMGEKLDDLKERLRTPQLRGTMAPGIRSAVYAMAATMDEAAATIEALEAENASLHAFSTELERDLATIPCQTKGNEDVESGCCAPCRARQALGDQP